MFPHPRHNKSQTLVSNVFSSLATETLPPHLDAVMSDLNGIMSDLPYDDKNVVHKHVSEALALCPELLPKAATNQLELVGAVNGRDFVNIHLPSSYPKDPPHVWVDCQYGTAINPGLTNVAPNGLVVIPYIANWDGDKSSLVSLISHLQVEFTRQPPTFVIDVGIPLSHEQVC